MYKRVGVIHHLCEFFTLWIASPFSLSEFQLFEQKLQNLTTTTDLKKWTDAKFKQTDEKTDGLFELINEKMDG